MGLDHGFSKKVERDVVTLRKNYLVDQYVDQHFPLYWERRFTIDDIQQIAEYLRNQILKLEDALYQLDEVIDNHREGDTYAYWRSE